MTDPFSILVGAVGLAGATLKVAQTTEDFIKGIKGAPQAVQSLSDKVDSLREVLKSLDVLLENSRGHGRTTDLVRLSPVLIPPLNYCKKSLDDIDKGLRPFVKPLDSSDSIGKWRAFQWKYRERDIVRLQQNLNNSQIMLTTAVQAVSLSSQTREFGNMRNVMKRGFNFDMDSVVNSSLIGSDEPVTEYNFALKRYLLDAEVIPEDGEFSGGSADISTASESQSRPKQDTRSDDEEDRGGATEPRWSSQWDHHRSLTPSPPPPRRKRTSEDPSLNAATQQEMHQIQIYAAEDSPSASKVRKSLSPPPKKQMDELVVDLSILKGLRVREKGEVLGQDGELLGHLEEGSLEDLVGKEISDYGEILDEDGDVVGRVSLLPDKSQQLADQAMETLLDVNLYVDVELGEAEILDRDRTLLGEVIEGRLENLLGGRLIKSGEILDEDGHVIGRIKVASSEAADKLSRYYTTIHRGILI